MAWTNWRKNSGRRRIDPQAVRRVWIPKPDGKQAAVGHPDDQGSRRADGGGAGLGTDLRGRPAAGAIRLPAGRSALDAVQAVQALLNTGHTEVVDADLSGYFDSIPHAELMKSVARRVSDRHLLHLIKMWLEAPVEETDERGRTQRTTRNKDEGRGTPQGAPLSPLLANLYMRRFVLGWKVLGHERRLDAHIVNYADDFVICCRGSAGEGDGRHAGHDGQAEVDGEREEDAAVSGAGRDVRLSGVHHRSVLLAADGLGLHRDPAVGQEGPSGCAGRSASRPSGGGTWLDAEEMVGRLNRMLGGWANYFCLGPVSKAYRSVISPRLS